MSLIDQYKICLERGHDTRHAISKGTISVYRCQYCGTSFHDEVVRKEMIYHPDVYAYLQSLEKNND